MKFFLASAFILSAIFCSCKSRPQSEAELKALELAEASLYWIDRSVSPAKRPLVLGCFKGHLVGVETRALTVPACEKSISLQAVDLKFLLKVLNEPYLNQIEKLRSYKPDHSIGELLDRDNDLNNEIADAHYKIMNLAAETGKDNSQLIQEQNSRLARLIVDQKKLDKDITKLSDDFHSSLMFRRKEAREAAAFYRKVAGKLLEGKTVTNTTDLGPTEMKDQHKGFLDFGWTFLAHALPHRVLVDLNKTQNKPILDKLTSPSSGGLYFYVHSIGPFDREAVTWADGKSAVSLNNPYFQAWVYAPVDRPRNHVFVKRENLGDVELGATIPVHKIYRTDWTEPLLSKVGHWGTRSRPYSYGCGFNKLRFRLKDHDKTYFNFDESLTDSINDLLPPTIIYLQGSNTLFKYRESAVGKANTFVPGHGSLFCVKPEKKFWLEEFLSAGHSHL